MFSKRLIGLLLLIACVLFAPPVVADLSIVADLDSNATNGPDSTGIDSADTVLVRLWITGADSMYAFGLTVGDTSGVFEWISDTSSVIYVTPDGWTNTEVQLDTSTGWLLLQATDFGLDTPLHTPCEIARLQFTSDEAGECAEFVVDISDISSGWLDTDVAADTFSSFEAAKICVKSMMGGGLGPVSGGLSSDADWSVTGGNAGDSLGASVATAGDLNGDDYSDVVIGAPYFRRAGGDTVGAIFVYFGSETGLSESPADTLVGGVAGGRFGFSVATAGDMDGDGLHDLLVGAPGYVDAGNDIDGGAVFVYRWDANGDSLVLDATLSPDHSDAEFGFSVAWAGEIDSDEFDDFIVGAPGYDDGGAYEGGAAFVFYGASGGPTNTHADTLTLDQSGARFGHSVSGAGDVDADGRKDVLVGAPHYNDGSSNQGAARVYRGTSTGIDTSLAWSITGGSADDVLGVSVSIAGDVDGNGYTDVIVGAPGVADDGVAYVYQFYASFEDTLKATLDMNQDGSQFGASVATAGDVDGDGYADVIVGAPGFNNGESNEGVAFVYLGSKTGLGTMPADTLENDQAEARFGTCVATAGDVDGRGYSDVIAGAPAYSLGKGGAFVYHGDIFLPDTTADWEDDRDQANAHFGGAASTAGDLNGDGYSDIIVGAESYDLGGVNDDEGAVFVYLGSDSGPPDDPDFTLGIDENNAAFGASVAVAGDLNNDGYSDIIIGAPKHNNRGMVYVYMGADSSNLASSLAAPADSVEPSVSEAEFGSSVAAAGDVNADGYGDIIVGAFRWGTVSEPYEGRAFVYLGSDTVLATFPSNTLEPPGDDGDHEYGYSVAGAGDVNGDGYSDVIVGAPKYDFDLSQPTYDDDSGAVFIYLGNSAGVESIPFKTIKGGADEDLLGHAVSGAGDVNGDGYSDFLIHSNGYDGPPTNTGLAVLWLGNPDSTLIDSVWATRGSGQNDRYGSALAPAGDLNGDGLGDFLVGSSGKDNGIYGNAGEAKLFLGADSPSTSAAWGISPEKIARFGSSVATAGDVNGDGFGDIIVGAYSWDAGTSGGKAFVYYGNVDGGLDRIPRQIHKNGDPLFILGKTKSPNEAYFALVAQGRTPAGRDTVWFESETRKYQKSFSGSPNAISERKITGSVASPGGSVVSITDTLGPLHDNLYGWRLRVASRNPFFPRAPWFSPPYNSPMEPDLRVKLVNVSVSANVPPVSSVLSLGPGRPNPFNPSTTIRYSLSQRGKVRLGVYDIHGRLVKTIVETVREEGNHVETWNGMNNSGDHVASGVYFLRIAAGGVAMSRKILLIR